MRNIDYRSMYCSPVPNGSGRTVQSLVMQWLQFVAAAAAVDSRHLTRRWCCSGNKNIPVVICWQRIQVLEALLQVQVRAPRCILNRNYQCHWWWWYDQILRAVWGNRLIPDRGLCWETRRFDLYQQARGLLSRRGQWLHTEVFCRLQTI